MRCTTYYYRSLTPKGLVVAITYTGMKSIQFRCCKLYLNMLSIATCLPLAILIKQNRGNTYIIPLKILHYSHLRCNTPASNNTCNTDVGIVEYNTIIIHSNTTILQIFTNITFKED